MTTTVSNFYRRWQQHRKQRKVSALLLQREQIRQSGMSIYAVIEDSYCTGLEAEGMKLLRIRLRIRLLDNCILQPVAYVFVPVAWGQVRGLPARVQFKAGDLSQVIIRI